MTPEQRQGIIDSQRYALKRHGFHVHSLLWSNTEIQHKRFDVLTKVGIQSGDSVLDVGCGFGDFYDYLQAKGINIEFTGIDLSAELLEVGREHYPEINLFQGDLFDFKPDSASFDYVTLSGTLNREFDDNGEYAFKTLTCMFETCKKGIAFNLLDARHEWTAGRWDLQSFLPQEIEKFAKSLSQKVIIIDGYLENDFSVYIYRD